LSKHIEALDQLLAEALGEAHRLHEWQAPTGQWLRPRGEFKHRHHRGRWRFVAFVADGDNSHVEAVKVGGPSNVRSFRPEDVVRVFRPAPHVEAS
jgi:hypothetical protein